MLKYNYRHQHPVTTRRAIILVPKSVPTQRRNRRCGLVVYPAEFMQEKGANTPIEGLRQLPFFVGTTETENDSNGGDGSAFINLYGLGANNVLTLINGRRAFSFSDINAIPISALARTEIFDGGLYGSDSTAGVVNFRPGLQRRPDAGRWSRLH